MDGSVATGIGAEEGGWDAVSVTDYELCPIVIEEMRQKLLNAPHLPAFKISLNEKTGLILVLKLY